MIIDAIFNEDINQTYTKAVAQYDKGLSIRFTGIELPEEFEVHFSNEKDYGIATVVKGKDNIAKIPDAYLYQGDYIYAWVYAYGKVKTKNYVVEGEIMTLTPTEGERIDTRQAVTVCQVIIPVQHRPVPVSVPEESDKSDTEIIGDYGIQDESLILG